MFAWLSEASTRASRAKRASQSASDVSPRERHQVADLGEAGSIRERVQTPLPGGNAFEPGGARPRARVGGHGSRLPLPRHVERLGQMHGVFNARREAEDAGMARKA